MVILNTANVGEYLLAKRPDWGPIHGASYLGGGVSNTVILVDFPSHRIVLKQALSKLNVEQDWYADQARTIREYRGLQTVHKFLPPKASPTTLFLDSENYIYAMQAAPAGAVDWKQLLLSGKVDPAIAGSIGQMLGAMISASWKDPPLESEFGDQSIFGQLRLDPYYKATANQHKDLQTFFGELAASCAQRRNSLVHGDWSPKNLLVSVEGVMAIDFEVVHFGDAAFDAGFLLNHLLLKSFLLPHLQAQFEAAGLAFWRALEQSLPIDATEFEAFTVRHWCALMLSRMDGKSPAEYIKDPSVKQRIRDLARHLIQHPVDSVETVWVQRSKA